MHPIPSATEIQFLIGLEVGQICIDPWSIQIRFEGGGQMTIFGAFEHVDALGRSHHYQGGDEQDRGPVFLRDVIQRQIVGVDRTDALLKISFANGSELRIGSEIGPYETAVFQAPGSEQKAVVF